MSATLEDATINPLSESGIIRNHIPANREDIDRFVEFSYRLAQIPSPAYQGKKTIRPVKKTTKKTLSLDAGRMF